MQLTMSCINATGIDKIYARKWTVIMRYKPIRFKTDLKKKKGEF